VRVLDTLTHSDEYRDREAAAIHAGTLDATGAARLYDT
jgi:hypothetical protein